LLCRELLQMQLPAPLENELWRSKKVGWLMSTAISAMTSGHDEQRPLERPFGTTRGSLSAILLGDNWHYRLVELRNLFINQTDVLAVPLPKPLWWLYPLLRLPLWVWRHAQSIRSATQS
jgi:hypothetical protein